MKNHVKNHATQKRRSVKQFLLAVLTLLPFAFALLSPSAFANRELTLRNPLIRVCTINNGVFASYAIDNDQFAFCRFGKLIIDSQTLLSSLSSIQTEASGAILSDTVSSNCEQVGATRLTIPEAGETLCRFRDDSMLNLRTLLTDANSANNNDREHIKRILLNQ